MVKTYSAANLIVGVTYYQNRAKAAAMCCNDYEQLMFLYRFYIRCIHGTGIKAGATADVLADFIEQVDRMANVIAKIGRDYSRKIRNFLEDIDTADDVLFKNEGRKILTDEEFNNAMSAALVDLSWDTLGTYLWERTLGFAKNELGFFEEIDEEKGKMYKLVKELNEVSKGELQQIKGNVRAVDNHYRTQLLNVYKELRNYAALLNKLIWIMAPKENNFTSKNIADLSKAIDQAEKFHQKVVLDPNYNEVSDDDVKYFCDNVEDYFEYSTMSIKSLCENCLGSLFLTEFATYRATVNAAKEYFNSYSKDYVQSKEAFDSVKADFDEMLKLYNQYGSKFAENFPDKEKAGMFNRLVKRASEFSEDIEKYIDIWYQMFFDMSESKKVLERFKANCDTNNENVIKALERIEDLYDKKLDAYLDETFEELRLDLETGSKKIAVTAIVEALKKKNRIIGELVDITVGQAFKEVDAIALYDWVETTDTSFENAVRKLKATNPNSPDYAVNVKAVREAFEAAKQARLNFFKEMGNSYADGTDKKAYCEYAYSVIEDASLNEWEKLNILSYSDYIGTNYNPLTDASF